MDQASGARNWTNGGWFTRRGAGTPVRPPAVCSKRTQPSPNTGSACSVGIWAAWNVTPFAASSRRVLPIRAPPQ